MLLKTRSDFAAQLPVEVLDRVGTPLRIDLTFTDALPRPLKAPSRATSTRLLKIICCPPDLDSFAATEHRRLATFRTSSVLNLCDCLGFLDQNSWHETRTETTPHSCHPWGPMPLPTSTERTDRIAAVSCSPKRGEHELCVGEGERGE